jgi:hypothetical protein
MENWFFGARFPAAGFQGFLGFALKEADKMAFKITQGR